MKDCMMLLQENWKILVRIFVGIQFDDDPRS